MEANMTPTSMNIGSQSSLKYGVKKMCNKFENWSPKGSRWGPNMEPKTLQKRGKKGVGYVFASGSLPGPVWAPIWLHL